MHKKKPPFLASQKVWETIDKKSLIIRKANIDDLMTYYEWANDSTTRENSINKEKISLENHDIWFNRRLNSPNTIFYIFEAAGKPVGQLRFDLEEKVAVINFSVASDCRGKGFGKNILQDAVQTLIREEKKIERIIGIVKDKNVSSAKIFEKFGFKRGADKEIEEQLYYSYFLEDFKNQQKLHERD